MLRGKPAASWAAVIPVFALVETLNEFLYARNPHLRTRVVGAMAAYRFSDTRDPVIELLQENDCEFIRKGIETLLSRESCHDRKLQEEDGELMEVLRDIGSDRQCTRAAREAAELVKLIGQNR